MKKGEEVKLSRASHVQREEISSALWDARCFLTFKQNHHSFG